MRVATWNVNSVKQRLPRLLPWLDERRPDVVCLQETKLADDAFDELLGEELAGRGYALARHGEVQWNGVAILSRVGLEDVAVGSPARPASRTRRRARCRRPAAGSACTRSTCPTAAPRTPSTTATSSRGSPRSRTMVGAGPQAAMVCGDMNIAPADIDVFDPEAYVGQTHVTPPERAALARAAGAAACATSCAIAGRPSACSPTGTTAPGCSIRTSGCGSTSCSRARASPDRVRAAWVDRQARKGTGPSDHAPVIVDLDEAPDGDIGPVVPPPPRRRGAGR